MPNNQYIDKKINKKSGRGNNHSGLSGQGRLSEKGKERM